MGSLADYALKTLGVRLPEDYAAFMESNGKRLSDGPIRTESWLRGLGSPDFVIETTLAFHSQISNFGRENVVIGYVGIKSIVLNKAYEEIDEYLMLDTRDGSVLTVDSLGWQYESSFIGVALWTFTLFFYPPGRFGRRPNNISSTTSSPGPSPPNSPSAVLLSCWLIWLPEPSTHGLDA
jgi:hypothetical protein